MELGATRDQAVAAIRAAIRNGQDAGALRAAYDRFLEQPAADRSQRGAFYTPSAIVDHLLDQTLEPLIAERRAAAATDDERARTIASIRVCDPACGTGAFLLRAAERLRHHLVACGADARAAAQTIAQHCIFGADTDAAAVELCRYATGAPSPHILITNPLLHPPSAFTGLDVFVGNPPFLTQLKSRTALSRDEVGAIRDWAGDAVRPYTDPAALFLLLSLHLARPGARIALIQPLSFLSARDTAAVRIRALHDAALQSIWIGHEPVFPGTNVLTCAPSFQVGAAPPTHISRALGASCTPSSPKSLDRNALAGTWGSLANDAFGMPMFGHQAAGTLTDVAAATADFRDQYYGLDGFIVEDDVIGTDVLDARYPPILTAGLIDLAACHWGERPTRLLKHTWRAPRIDRDRMAREGALADWITTRLVPKIILATQTKIIELIVDVDGRLLPSTPLITVTPRDQVRIWHVAAALASPVCTALALERHLGAALSGQAIKLSAKQALALPVPEPSEHWDAAAIALRDAHLADAADVRTALLDTFATDIVRAYAVPERDAKALLAWWRSRH